MIDMKEKESTGKKVTLPVDIYYHRDTGDQFAGVGRTMEISRGGANIQSPVYIPVNTTLKLEIRGARKLVTTYASVNHTAMLRNKGFQMGVTFSNHT